MIIMMNKTKKTIEDVREMMSSLSLFDVFEYHRLAYKVFYETSI